MERAISNKTFILSGDNFANLKEFFDEAEKVLTKGLSWKIGRNLDALDDVLWGGFGQFEDDEPIILIWKNAKKSQKDLGYDETAKYLEKVLKGCHPANIKGVQKRLISAKNNEGPTVFDTIIEIIKAHGHIQLILE